MDSKITSQCNNSEDHCCELYLAKGVITCSKPECINYNYYTLIPNNWPITEVPIFEDQEAIEFMKRDMEDSNG